MRKFSHRTRIKSGRGVPTIIDTYGKDAITFREKSIVVTIPFNRLNEVGKKVGKKVGNSDVNRPILNPRRQTILLEIEQNPYVTKHELSEIIGISTTAIDNNIAYLRNNGLGPVDRKLNNPIKGTKD